jgi:hypothetical protein
MNKAQGLFMQESLERMYLRVLSSGALTLCGGTRAVSHFLRVVPSRGDLLSPTFWLIRVQLGAAHSTMMWQAPSRYEQCQLNPLYS